MHDTTLFIKLSREISALEREGGNEELVMQKQIELKEWIDTKKTFSEPHNSSYITFNGVDLREETREKQKQSRLNNLPSRSTV